MHSGRGPPIEKGAATLDSTSPSTLYIIPPALSLVIGLVLAAVALRRGWRQAENRFFAVTCIWWSLLAPVFICHLLIENETVILRIERCVHFLYVFLPPLTIAFVHRILGIRRPVLTGGAIFLSGVLALFTPTELYFNGLYTFSWGSIARGGPAFQVFGVYCIAAVAYLVAITLLHLRREENPIRRQRTAYIALSLCGMGFLTLLNIPAINGIDLYPAGNFTFLPLGVMAYGVLRYRLMDIQSMVLRSLLWLLTSSLILVPNALMVYWLQPLFARIGPFPMLVIVAVWFLANHAYIRRVQPQIDRLFNKDRRRLHTAVEAFMVNAAALKRLEDLATELRALVTQELGIERISIYLAPTGGDRLEEPLSGDGLVISKAVRHLLTDDARTLARPMVETHPAYTAVAREIQTLLHRERAEYLVPLIQDGRFMGIMLLSPPASGRRLAPHELRFLDRFSTAGVAFANAALFQRVADLKEALENQSNTLVREIHERERISEALSASQEKLRLMADNITDVLWVLGMDMRFTYISPSVEKMRGWTAEAFKALTLDQVLTPESLKKAMALLDEKLRLAEATGNYQQDAAMELEEYCKSGKTIHTEARVSFLTGDDGKPTGILGVTRDVSERVAAQKEKELLQAQLARSKKMEALGLLAGGVAHDLNNILSGLTSFPQLLLEELPADSDLRESLTIIEDCGLRASAVVSDLITIARGVASPREAACLNRIVEDHMDSPTHGALRAHHPDVIFTTQMDARLLGIDCSRIHIEKVLMNLLSNAAEALPEGGRVTISTRNEYVDRPLKGYDTVATGEYCVLRVADDGPGIAPGDLERIFEPFYTRKVMGRSGTGLGLAVVWNTVQDHNGYILVDSGPAGTRFDIYLPGVRTDVCDVADAMPPERIGGNGETVLVVDDEPYQCKIATSILKHLGYRATAVGSGEAALAYLKDHEVSLLLLDMVMPAGISGRQTYEAVCRIRPGQKAVIASGFSETADVAAVQRLGAGAFVKKPYQIETLGSAVKTTLGSDG